MFQEALLESQPGRSKRSALGLPFSLFVHGLLIGGAVGAAAWFTDEPPEPQVRVVFSVPPGPPRGGEPPSSGKIRAQTGAARPLVRQTIEVPVTIPDLPTVSKEQEDVEGSVGREGTDEGSESHGVTGSTGNVPGRTGTIPGTLRGDPPRPVGGDVIAPELVWRVEPGYPEAARKVRIEGVVILEAVISASGEVEDLRVIKSVNRILDSAAMDAVAQWKYRPATLSGRAVRVFLTVTVNFRLR